MARGSIDSAVFLQLLLMRQGLGRVESVASSPVGVLVRPVGTIVALASGGEAWINVDGTIAGWMPLADLEILRELAVERAAGSRGLVEIETWSPTSDSASYDFTFEPSAYRRLQMVGRRLRKAGDMFYVLRVDGGTTETIWGNVTSYGSVTAYTGGFRLHPLANARAMFITDLHFDGPDMLVSSLASTKGGTYLYRIEGSMMVSPTVSIGVGGPSANAFEAGVSTVELWGEPI